MPEKPLVVSVVLCYDSYRTAGEFTQLELTLAKKTILVKLILMILDVISKKNFTRLYSSIKTDVYELAPYGAVEVVYTDKHLHSLRPSDQIATKPFPQFDRFVVVGTPFQADVWRYLLTIPSGQTQSYTDVAIAIGRPKACRAVGQAVGANPIGILIPCHRILAKDQSIGGFAWGTDMKIKWLSIEKI